MCYTAILPTTMSADHLGSDTQNLIYLFNRWLKMLTTYGKLDETYINDDFNVIAAAIKANTIAKNTVRFVKKCRDYALSISTRYTELTEALTTVLRLLCKSIENHNVRKVAKMYADQGMTEKFRPLSKRLAKEKIRKIGRSMVYTDWHTDDKETTRLVRRIVEKRAAQAVHRSCGKRNLESNKYRHSVKRATSFSLYNKRYADYDIQLRAQGTHWKVARHNSKGGKVLVAKLSYNSYEEAVEAINTYVLQHPEESAPMSAYLCNHCGKWHIGHNRENIEIQHEEDMLIQKAV